MTPLQQRQSEDLTDSALNWLQTNVQKIILGRLVPLIVGTSAVTIGLAWLQDAIGIDLNPADVTAFIATTILGVSSLAFQYVRNHGHGQAHLGGILLELEKIQQAGASTMTDSGTPRDATPTGAVASSSTSEASSVPVAPPGVTRDAP